MTPVLLNGKSKVLEASSTVATPLHNISADPRIKEYLLGVTARLTRGNVLLQMGRVGILKRLIANRRIVAHRP